jgi:hypothetical protein
MAKLGIEDFMQDARVIKAWLDFVEMTERLRLLIEFLQNWPTCLNDEILVEVD